MVAVCVVAGCGTAQPRGAESGFQYEVQHVEPHPGIAQGRPVVEVQEGTFYLCPEVAVGQPTPLITDRCLIPGSHIGHTAYGEYSMLEASVTCPDGRKVTDAVALGFGFVGGPLIGHGESHHDAGAALECLWSVDR
jgi:hypothetical protein